MFLGGLSIAIYKGPIFSLVCIAYLPVIFICVAVLGAITKKAQFKKLEANKVLGGFTEESLFSLKLIVSFA
jgi:ABC-type transport system involved in cytochrome bd biosynthesis fused ATPase/permease subunit